MKTSPLLFLSKRPTRVPNRPRGRQPRHRAGMIALTSRRDSRGWSCPAFSRGYMKSSATIGGFENKFPVILKARTWVDPRASDGFEGQLC